MITTVDTQPWSAADLTGNSAFVSIGNTIYLAGSHRVIDNAIPIYKSTDKGRNWTTVATLPSQPGALDPAIALDAFGILYIILSQPQVGSPERYDLLFFTFDTNLNTLSDVTRIITGSKAQAAYDLIVLPDGGVMVCTAAQEPQSVDGFAEVTQFANNYVLLVFEVMPDHSVAGLPLSVQHWSSGETYGGISLLHPSDSAPVELYYTAHQRVFPFHDVTTEIRRRTSALTGGTWTAPTVVHTLRSRYIDDKLTVIALPNGRRAMATTYYTWWKKLGLQTSVTYGMGTQDPDTGLWTWEFNDIKAGPYFSFKEPVVETDGTNVYLCYLRCPYITKLPGETTGKYTQTGFLQVSAIDPITLVEDPHPGAWQGMRFSWLRGSKQVIPDYEKWEVVGIKGSDQSETIGGGTIFLSEYNLPPVPIIHPSVATLQRGVLLTLSAAETQDPDMDPMVFTWTHNSLEGQFIHLTPSLDGTTCGVFVDKTIGPLPHLFMVTVSVSDGINPPVSIGCLITVPFNAQPVITLDDTMVLFQRNLDVGLAAKVTDADHDLCDFLWQQMAGTPVEIIGEKTLTPVLKVYRMNLDGEVLVFRFLVRDGVNRDVSKEISILVPPVAETDLDNGRLARSFFMDGATTATIAQRNDPGKNWGRRIPSETFSDFTNIKIVNTVTGDERFLYISRKSLLALSQGDTNVFFRRLYPGLGKRIQDAAHDELDQSYLLLDDGALLRYHTPGPAGGSDWPDNAVNLSNIMVGPYTGLYVNPLMQQKRVIAAWGRGGLLMIHIQDDTFTILDTLRINIDSGLLPAGSNITFVRFGNVQSLKSGQAFIGTTNGAGESTEVLIDLAARRDIGIWDKGNKVNRLALTGELLAIKDEAALGRPSAPSFNEPEILAGGTYNLSWTQIRPDLVVGYELWMGFDDRQAQLIAAIPSGTVRRYNLLTSPGHTYHLFLRAQGSGSMSSFSLEQTLTT